MPRPDVCADCGDPLEFDERTRTWTCFACDEVEAVDTALGGGMGDVHEYDEEDRA
jgi:hypothetical protein